MAADIEPVIIVGAGIGGLSAADALKRRGIAATVLEKEARLAEPWRGRHERLALNTHRDLSYLRGMRFPRGTPAFPSKEAVVALMERFVAERGVAVAFGTAVERVARDGDHWRLETGKGTRRARNVVIATGRDQVPWIPEWPGAGQFGGEIVHAAAFGRAETYNGKSVLVVGAGNSGFDVLNHLSKARPGPIWLSARKGPSLLPRRIGKVAIPRFGWIMNVTPTPIADFAVRAMQRLAFGDLTRHGLPAAPGGGATRLRDEHIALAVDDGAAAALKAGRITVVAPIGRFTGDGVVLADGAVIRPDVVIAATGYRSGLETMLEGLDVLDAKGGPKANGAMPSGQPGLWFIGMRPSLVSQFYATGKEGKAIAAEIARHVSR